MSLCLDHGHTEARHYPLGVAQDEAALIVERVNGQIVTEAQLTKLAVEGILSKGSRKQFSKLVKQLNVTVTPRAGLFGEPTKEDKEIWGDGA